MNNIITVKKEALNLYSILLVDDRAENLLTLENIIEREGRKIIKASSGNEALKIALAEKVDIILLDVQMPDMDGYEVADLLRLNPKTKNIPIIFVSAVSRNEKIPMDKFEEGTVDFLFKPLDIYETKSKLSLFEKIYWAVSEKKKCLDKFDQMSKDMDHFVYVVSHDIKAPLRAVENLATWIEEDLSGTTNPGVKENLSLLKNRVARMQSLLDGITEYSRVGRINESREQVNVNALIQYVLDVISPPSTFKFKIQENLPVLFAEKTKLVKIFTQLINNCIIHHHKNEGYISISSYEENGVIRFTIKDDGPGINPRFFEKVFEIFHTLQPKDKHETSGVGLSIVKKIIDSMGQKVWFDADITSGTSINFTWLK